MSFVELKLECLKLANQFAGHLGPDEVMERAKKFEAFCLQNSTEKVGNSDKSRQDSLKEGNPHSKKPTPK